MQLNIQPLQFIYIIKMFLRTYFMKCSNPWKAEPYKFLDQ